MKWYKNYLKNYDFRYGRLSGIKKHYSTKGKGFTTIKYLGHQNIEKELKDVGVDNWALFYTFSSEVSEKPGFRNN